MFLTIHIILLLFAFGSSKHTLSRIQITNGSEIYQIREKPNNIIEIIEPKSKIPTLREIIYFKIKETPYISHHEEEEPPQEEGPDFDESKRPFTNGPGFQFIDYGPIDNASSDSDSGSSGSDSRSTENNPDSNGSSGRDRDRHENNNNSKESKNDSKESNNDNYEGKIDVYKSKIENNSENKADNDKLISGSFDADKNYLDKDKDNEENDYNKDLNKIFNQGTKPTAVNKTEAVTQERNEQFDEAKEKHPENNKKSDNSTKLLRRKREISYNIPPPPSLPPLNLKMLPGFIQRMITNVPALRNIVSPDEGESNYQGENRPGTYGIHLNKDKGFMWNNLPFINQGNYINDPSNMINKKKKEEYPTDNSPESDDSNSEGDDNSVYKDKDSAEPEEETDQSFENISITPPIWPVIVSPSIGFNKIKPHQSITKEKELDNSVSKVCKTCNEQHKSTIQGTTDKNIVNNVKKCYQLENLETEPKKALVCAQNNLKKKIEKSFDNAGQIKPPPLSHMKQNIAKTSIKNSECDKAYACSERKKPISPPTNNFNLCKTKPTNADKCGTKTNELTNSPCQKDEGSTQVDPDISTKNQGQEPTKCNNLIEPQKESLNKERKKPSSPPTNNFNLCKTKPTNADKCGTKTNELTNSPCQKDEGSTQVDPDISTKNQGQEPTKCNNLIEPQKESLNKERKKPSSPPTNNFNLCKTKPTNADKCGTKTNELTNSPCQKDEGSTQVDPDISTKNQGQEPTKCNNLIEPQKESLNKEREKPSCPPTDNFNQCKTKPTNADKCGTKTNESTNSPPHEDKGTTQVVPESSTKNQTLDTPTKSNNSNEPKRESLNKNKENSDDKKDNKDVEAELDNLLKKDEFWKWITKWTAGYIAGLNVRVEQLVKKQIAKQVNETENQQNEKEKDKIDTNKNDLIKQNETIANGTTDEPANKTNENNDNVHNTTEKSIPKINNTDSNIAPNKEQSNVMNETVSNGPESNKTTPANPQTTSNATNANEVNANVTTENNTPETNNTDKNISPKKVKSKIVPNGHRSNKTTPAIPNTIYGNAMDSDHVTNIFIFYPNAANNETAKDIEAFLGNKNNNVEVAGTPPNDNKAPESGPALANKTATSTDPALAKKTAPPADPALDNKTAAPADTVPATDTAAKNATLANSAAPSQVVPNTNTPST